MLVVLRSGIMVSPGAPPFHTFPHSCVQQLAGLAYVPTLHTGGTRLHQPLRILQQLAAKGGEGGEGAVDLAFVTAYGWRAALC